MALELDPDWPGLTDKSDASGKGDPALRTPEIKRIAGEVQKILATMTTPTEMPATQVAYAKGSTPPPLPGPPAGAGSLPDLQRQCALSEIQLGEWPVAQSFSMATVTAYAQLIGEPGQGGGLYSSLIARCQAAIDGLIESAKSYDGAEMANQEDGTRRYV
ncbi:hypothetical protein [Streptosporangium roseum]|uniref:Uncharacterized protein n=1 Tax=Streptosporangium roseum (strain ATCC 12428 / DSM 43021 / JCM 3005 / KCTC 9067 / NCIMB 10171 / NRRL 2505 / NI 9100) TaxID=479432 RepID=D2AX20_STRRD|nr:hypothetical protein [Streptosporangium roseum]ACZ90747.1 hypothetical protein Sros_8092 [Streptosporangium roseum DSM 43021]